MIDNNWRFSALPYHVTSAEKAYYYNIILNRLSLVKRRTLISPAPITPNTTRLEQSNLLDLLGETDVNEHSLPSTDLLYVVDEPFD